MAAATGPEEEPEYACAACRRERQQMVKTGREEDVDGDGGSNYNYTRI
jgi:hypothetical protein